MGKLYDNKIIDGISKIADVLLIGLYFIICSIPVITIGAGLTGLYYAIHKCVYKGQGYTTSFFRSFKDNFKQSTLSWLVFMLLFIILGGDIYITRQVIPADSPMAVAPLFFMFLFAFTIVWAIYHFAYIARFTNGFKASFKVSGIIMVVNLGWSFVILLLVGFFALLVYRFIFMYIFAPVLFTCVLHPLMERIFRKYMTPEDLAAEEE